MNPFHDAKNFFGVDYLPQQLTWAGGLFLLSRGAVMAGLVLIRRGFGMPRRSAAGAVPPPNARASGATGSGHASGTSD